MKRSSAVVISRLRAPDTRRYDILFYVSYDVRVELCNVRARDIYSEKYADVEGSGGGRNMRTAAACVTFLNAAATAFVEEPDSVSSLLDLRPKRRSGAYTWAPATGTRGLSIGSPPPPPPNTDLDNAVESVERVLCPPPACPPFTGPPAQVADTHYTIICRFFFIFLFFIRVYTYIICS